MRNAECGVRNESATVGPDACQSIPHSEFRTPH